MIEVIDLFAGPGGLGEGFSLYRIGKRPAFKVCISIEKEKFAHQTLLLRSFYRQFTKPPKEYYDYLHRKITKEVLFEKYPKQAKSAKEEAWLAELGNENFPHKIISKRIREKLNLSKEYIVIGGPPCQAYSLVGRSKMSKKDDFEEDPRHTLYKEYLKIIAEFNPAVFIMENVKGILSAKLNGEHIFDRILEDIQKPSLILEPNKKQFKANETYSIYSLVADKPIEKLKRTDFTINCEEYGIPQRRHRVILVAVRNDIKEKPKQLKKSKSIVNVQDVINDLPKLRSGLSKITDTSGNWEKEILKEFSDAEISKNLNRGAEFIPVDVTPLEYKNWFKDKNLQGVLNHTTRSHISSDLHRYYFASDFAKQYGASPKLKDFPKKLLPNHKNVKKAIKSGSLFNDRFKVQMADKPSTTITSHISKDGHYFIHYDSAQCRSLTVREAARIQTFPDNYKFEGPRTSQYQQVGNAVPPLLAHQIAKVVYELISSGTIDNK